MRAAEAKDSKGGRRPAVAADQTGAMRTAYLEGRSIAAPAREHGVSRGAIRTAVAGFMPDHTAIEENVPAPELPVTLDMPGEVTDFFRTTGLEPAERATARPGRDRTAKPGLHPSRHRRTSGPPPTPRPMPAPPRRSGRPCDPGPAQGPPRVREPRQRPQQRHLKGERGIPAGQGLLRCLFGEHY
ncbi:resolvase [Streptomyces lasalocidi]